MARSNGLLALLVCAGFVVACQGDQGIPSEPGRELDLTAGGLCKDPTFTSAATIYTNASVQNGKLQACKEILALVKQDKVGPAELKIDELLVAIFNDYHLETASLAAVGSYTLPQSVANYIGAACGLAPLSAAECLVPKELDATPGIDEDELKGWLAAGPLTGTEGPPRALGTGVLPNGIFGFGVESTSGTFVFASERPRTGVDGPCPENFANDCQDDVFDVDVDVQAPQSGFQSLTVESCAVFGSVHVHCPEGEACVKGDPTAPLDLVSPTACTAAGYTTMGLLGQLAFQATRPAQWLIQATPAYAGTSTKLGFFSPVVLADGDPRQRGVICDVTANYPSGSEGTKCEILDHGISIASCTTVSSGPYTSNCSMTPLVPDNLSLLMTAAKTGGDGAYNASQAFTLGPADPERGETKTVSFNLQPPGKKKN